MPKTTPKRYVNIKVVDGLADSVDQIIEVEKFGYRSRGEFCHHAIRHMVEHYWKILDQSIER